MQTCLLENVFHFFFKLARKWEQLSWLLKKRVSKNVRLSRSNVSELPLRQFCFVYKQLKNP